MSSRLSPFSFKTSGSGPSNNLDNSHKIRQQTSMKNIGASVIVVVTAISALVLASWTVQAQSVVVNGDFSGVLDDWTVVPIIGYTNAPYSYGVGPYTVFPETGTAKSFSAQVGNPVQLNLEQTVSLSAGVQYNFTADVAANYPTYNVDGGTITLTIGGNEVSSISFGGDNTGGPLYGTLDGSYLPEQSGNELLILNFSRNYIADAYTPSDFITDISLVPVPEPSPIVLLGLGICALALRRASCEGINKAQKLEGSALEL